MAQTTYTNLQIWDGFSDGYSEHRSLTIEGDRIASIQEKPTNGVDCSGLTVIPGLMDAHVHMTLEPSITTPMEQLNQSREKMQADMVPRARRMVQAGITTARDLGGGKWAELELRDRINRGEIPGPRLLCAGQPVTSTKGHCWFWGGEAASIDEANEVIERQARHGVDVIKIMATGGKLTANTNPGVPQFTQAELEAMITAASQNGLRTAAHCHGTQGIGNAAKAGITTIEHCSWMNEERQRTAFDEDISFCIGLNGVFVSPTIHDKWSQFRNQTDDFVPMIQEQFRTMKRHNVRLIASTDAGIPHVHHHDLAKALIEFSFYADLTPAETLRAATSTCAEALGIEDLVGTIAPDMCADLAFVEGDPLADLSVLQSPVRVIAKGIEQDLSQ